MLYDPSLPIIMSTGEGNEQIASESIKAGAMDYISKDNITQRSIKRVLKNAIERKSLSNALAEQQAALSVFAQVLVHDIKAPIQSIFGFARLIEAGLRKEEINREKLSDLIQRVTSGALRMVNLIDALHDYSKSDQSLAMQEISLNDAAANAVSNLDAAIMGTCAEVSIEELPTVCGELSRLSQLFQNLIGNSIKYCDQPSPHIQIGAEKIDDGNWRIHVRDNGIGIPKGKILEVFQPFTRLHSQGEYDGSGLGLATCKKIVEQHGGAIWCKPNPNSGSTFYFTLPILCPTS